MIRNTCCFPAGGRRQRAKSFRSAAPRRGARRVETLGHWLSHIRLTFTLNIQTEYGSWGSTSAADPSQNGLVVGPENHQNFRPQNKCIFLQKWNPMGSPKNHKNCQKLLPGAHFLPLLILVWKFHDFLTPWNLENDALVYTKHLFSLFHPTRKMSSKWLPKTTFGHQMATKCPKMGHHKIHEKSHSTQ